MYQNIMKKSNDSIVKQKKDKPEGKNMTGIPSQMRMKFEGMSGLSFDDVKVHYNSDKPAQMKALAYTQGNDVYIGPGQEKHLGHELGHVVQQKQGRVKPTEKMGGQLVNSDAKLEKEADQMGATAIQMKRESGGENSEVMQFVNPHREGKQDGRFVGSGGAVHIHIVGGTQHVKNSIVQGRGAGTNFQDNIDGYRLAYSIIKESGWLKHNGAQECVAWLLQEAEGLSQQLVLGTRNIDVWNAHYPDVDIKVQHNVNLEGYVRKMPVAKVNKATKKGKK